MASRVYKSLIGAADKFVPSKLRPLWEHEAGPKTIFFWAPAFKWGLVMAGLGDLNRPVENLSLPQSVSLAATGIVWSRYSLVIVPKNYSLFAVNVFVACTSLYQIGRAIKHEFNKEKEGLVMAGLGDLNRPVESLSLPQSVSLAATGIIWSRYSLVIIPKNYSLFAVNVFVACTSLYQVSRAIKHEQNKKKENVK